MINLVSNLRIWNVLNEHDESVPDYGPQSRARVFTNGEISTMSDKILPLAADIVQKQFPGIQVIPQVIEENRHNQGRPLFSVQLKGQIQDTLGKTAGGLNRARQELQAAIATLRGAIRAGAIQEQIETPKLMGYAGGGVFEIGVSPIEESAH